MESLNKGKERANGLANCFWQPRSEGNQHKARFVVCIFDCALCCCLRDRFICACADLVCQNCARPIRTTWQALVLFLHSPYSCSSFDCAFKAERASFLRACMPKWNKIRFFPLSFLAPLSLSIQELTLARPLEVRSQTHYTTFLPCSLINMQRQG